MLAVETWSTIAVRSSFLRLALPLMWVSLLLMSCDVPVEEKTTPTIDVPPALEVDIGNDPVAAPRKPELVGVLPTDFPTALALHLPASLIDFGGQGRGGRWVDLLTTEPPATIRAAYESRRSSGWRVTATGTGLKLSKGGDAIALEFRDTNAGTVYRLRY